MSVHRLVILFALAAAASLQAQSQDRKLLDRIQKPDMTLASPFQARTYEGSGDLKVRAMPGADRQFAAGESPYAKEFEVTRSFFGIKNPWIGGKVFRETGTSFDAGKTFVNNEVVPVRKAEAVTYYDAGKPAAVVQNEVVEVRTFEARGKAQGAMDTITDKVTKDMTIDQVRELLNKPR